MKPHKHRNEIKAWAEGRLIQKQLDSLTWVDDPNPTWDPNLEYRVRPAMTSYLVHRRDHIWEEIPAADFYMSEVPNELQYGVPVGSFRIVRDGVTGSIQLTEFLV